MNEQMAAALIAAVAGLAGTIVGAGVAWYSSERRSKIQNSVDLHREWQGEEATRARMLADKFIHRNPGKDLLRLELESDPLEASNLWVVLNFFQRLSVLLRHRQLASYLIPELFGTYVVWWHVNCFESCLPKEWAIRRDWEFLHKWLEENSSPEDMARWHRNAEYARDNRKSRVGHPPSPTDDPS